MDINQFPCQFHSYLLITTAAAHAATALPDLLPIAGLPLQAGKLCTGDRKCWMNTRIHIETELSALQSGQQPIKGKLPSVACLRVRRLVPWSLGLELVLGRGTWLMVRELWNRHPSSKSTERPQQTMDSCHERCHKHYGCNQPHIQSLQ